MVSLSVLVPVYNEEHLVAASLARLEQLESSTRLSRVQVIVVDDCSTDATPAALDRFRRERGLRGDGTTLDGTTRKLTWRFLRHPRNGGKGSAIRTALAEADCDITVIHDADLEYHPKDLVRIANVFEEEQADAVFGSRFAGSEVRRVLLYRHELGNRLLTFLTNLVSDLNLSDMETCYKAIRTDLLKSIPLVSNDFRLEVELTIKLAKRGARLFEVPIRYSGRTYQEGKKIKWVDGVRALGAIARHALSDRIYADDAHGSQTLARLARAPRFNRWMADVVRPYCGQRVLEIGAGIGNLTVELLPRDSYVTTDINRVYLQKLKNLEMDRPYLRALHCDVTDWTSFPQAESFDTVVCLNVVEHVKDDVGALRNIRRALRPGGTAVILVPHDPALYGTLDEVLGHERRYTETSLREIAELAGFSVREIVPFNRTGTAAWWLNGQVLKRRHFGLGQVKLLNTLAPAFQKVDRALPLPPLSLIAILEVPALTAVSADEEAAA